MREYYERDGELLPGKKGISLDLPQWDKLVEAVPDIDAAIKQQEQGQAKTTASGEQAALLTVCCTDMQRLHTFTAVFQPGLHVNTRGVVSTPVSV